MHIRKTFILFIAFIFPLINICCNSDDNGDYPAPPTDTNKVKINVEFDINNKLIWGISKVQDRNFYVLTLFENLENSFLVLESDPVFKQYLTIFKSRLNTISTASNPTAQQYAEALKFTKTEIDDLSIHLREVVNESTVLQRLAIDYMGPCGAFQQFSEITNIGRFVQLAFIEAAEGINNIIDIYIAGIDPKYPDLDKVSYPVNSDVYLAMLNNEIDGLHQNQDNLKLFFQPALKAALKALEINGRDEAGRYFPLEENENKAAYEYIKTINWNEYPYAFVLVLGDSPDEPNDLPNISQGGMRNARQGVEFYQQGKVPLILLSGGHVRPFQTVYSEAIEMKKYILQQYPEIPENRILVEPQARHTTTNIRNAGRLVFRYGIPKDKKAIVTSEKTHINSLNTVEFEKRSMQEMNHVPAKFYERISDIYLEFTANIEVLHLDSSDPLDP